MPRPTKAQRARDLHAQHPELPPSEIARRLRTSRQAVHDALRATGAKPGRPSEGASVLLRERDLPPETLAAVRETAQREQLSIARVIADAVTAELLPELDALHVIGRS